ncbi:MAG TPA: type II secretion system secretin GspD [Stenotrophobium sp.]|jgi:general secretion pathway protein D|nr:type II secretion system secretin GspD [Stenotrophobium sp.]
MLRLKRILTAALLLTLAAPAFANVTLNLKDADINSLITTVSEVTGKNFIVDPRVKGKVTVISSSPMTPAGVYETFLAVLQVQGFAAVPAGQAIKIVPETNARTEGGVIESSGRGLPPDDVVTHVYQVQNISAAQLVPILRPLMAQWGHLAAYAPGNMLILSDRAANVSRIEELIAQMDQSDDRQIEVVHLKYAAASEVVRILSSLAQQDKRTDPTSQPATVIADERSNSVLLGGDKSERQKYIAIIQSLDVPLKEGGATQVVYLHYASAENLAPILQGYAQQVSQAETSASGATTTPTPASTSSSSGRGGSGIDGVHVLSDKDTNALVITAPPKTMRQIRDVIAQLDIQRAQVLVEAVVAEVSANRSTQLGVDWAAFNQNQIAAASILNPNTASALTAFGTAAATSGSSSAPLLGLISQGINVGGGVLSSGGTSLAVLVKALQGDGNTNVLSTPTLVTLDNQEAKFSVGQEVPFLTGSFSNTGTSSTTGVVNPFQTIDRKDVGLTLGVTPQINEGNHVKLKINLEVSGIASGTAGSSNLITNKRTLTNTVGVENGQILVIAGLIDNQIQDTVQGVPFLSSIPLLGSLFRYHSASKTKQNLMLFIRPTILRQKSDGDYYTRIKYDAIQQAQITSIKGAVPLVGGQRPVLPDFDDYQRQGLPPTPAAADPKAAPAPKPASPESARDNAGPQTPTAASPAASEPVTAPAPAPDASSGNANGDAPASGEDKTQDGQTSAAAVAAPATSTAPSTDSQAAAPGKTSVESAPTLQPQPAATPDTAH